MICSIERKSPLAQILWAIAAAGGCVLAAEAANAQASDAADASPAAQGEAAESEEVNEVTVTGTRIRGVGPVGSSLIGVSRDALEESGLATPMDVLRQVPQVLNFGVDENLNGGNVIQNSRIDNTFSKSINLRGLGSVATLTLVNGRRPPPAGVAAQLFDPDTIPQAAIGRVEVVPDGASAIYGSDAVAGVVNLVFRKPFNGAETSLRYGAADGTNQQAFSQLFSKAWDEGGILFAYERLHRDELLASKRPEQYNDNLAPFGGASMPTFGSPGNVIISGVTYAIPAGQNGTGLQTSELGPAGTPNRQSGWLGTYALPDIVRNSAVLTANQRLTDNIELFGEGYFSNRDFEVWTTAPTGTLSVPASNPYSPCNPANVSTGGPACPAGNITVQYSYINDTGNTIRTGYERIWGATAGLNFNLPAEWTSSLAFTYGEVREFTDNLNGVNSVAISQALGNTHPVYGPKPANVPYFNPFCDGDAFDCNDPATLAYISGHNSTGSSHGFQNIALNANGSLFSLPGGDVSLAIGAEAIEDRHAPVSFSTLNTPSVQFESTSRSGAKRHIKSYYAEVYVPIFGRDNAAAGLRKLELTVAGRVSDYSDFGSTETPKFGLNWEPLEGLQMRASYGKSFRAPTLADVDLLSTAIYQPFTFLGNQITTAALSPNSTYAVIFENGGNPALEPETAKTWSVGLDIEPPQLPGMRVNLTYYDIHYTNRIDTPAYNAGPIASLNTPSLYSSFINYNPLYYPDRATLTQDQFNALVAAQISSTNPPFAGAPPPVANVAALISGRRYNSGTLDTSGIDFTTQYEWNTGIGTWRVGAAGTYVRQFETSILPGATVAEHVNDFGYPMRFRARAELAWSKGGWSANTFVNYSNSYDIERLYIPPGAAVDYLGIASWTTVDATLRFRTGELSAPFLQNVGITLSVQNLLDKEPPLVLNNGTTPLLWDPQSASALGRFGSLQITKEW